MPIQTEDLKKKDCVVMCDAQNKTNLDLNQPTTNIKLTVNMAWQTVCDE